MKKKQDKPMSKAQILEKMVSELKTTYIRRSLLIRQELIDIQTRSILTQEDNLKNYIANNMSYVNPLAVFDGIKQQIINEIERTKK